jgi:hypothetical protein
MACTPGSLTMENYRNAERPTGNSLKTRNSKTRNFKLKPYFWTISLEGLSSGVYSVQIMNGAQLILSERLELL